MNKKRIALVFTTANRNRRIEKKLCNTPCQNHENHTVMSPTQEIIENHESKFDLCILQN